MKILKLRDSNGNEIKIKVSTSPEESVPKSEVSLSGELIDTDHPNLISKFQLFGIIPTGLKYFADATNSCNTTIDVSFAADYRTGDIFDTV